MIWEQVEGICLADSGGPGLGSVRQSLFWSGRLAWQRWACCRL